MMSISDLGVVLGVWAHPDDEAFLSAGLMAAARDAGRDVTVVTATLGELGTANPAEWPPERLAIRRRSELRRSMDILGVADHRTLGHPDGGCAALPIGIGARQVAAIIEEVKPDTILTFGPDGYTGHADHRTICAWVDEAVALTSSSASVLHATTDARYLAEFADVHERFDIFFAGWPAISEPDSMAVHVELSGNLLDRKFAALAAQSSQTAALIASLGEDRFRRWIAMESFMAADKLVAA